MIELWHIALCNTVYKIIAKILANRLKSVIFVIVFREKSTFVSGKAISDNVLVAFELLHYMKRKTHGKQGVPALKIDISKAYDSVRWSFFGKYAAEIGFC